MLPYSTQDMESDLEAAVARDDWESAQDLADSLDALDHARPASLLGAALWYAERGLPVFPLEPGGKRPWPRSHGVKDATTDEAQIRRWWSARPDANVGLATGHVVDVVDVDGPVGEASLARSLLDDDGRWLGPTPLLGVASTPRPGGRHLYVSAVDGRGNRAAILPGVDYRGAGGYVVAPPSVNAEGTAYVWVRPLALGG